MTRAAKIRPVWRSGLKWGCYWCGVAVIAHQMPAEDRRRRADFVIENDGDLAHLYAQVEALYQRLTSDPAR